MLIIEAVLAAKHAPTQELFYKVTPIRVGERYLLSNIILLTSVSEVREEVSNESLLLSLKCEVH
jgi:hypothetical protein